MKELILSAIMLSICTLGSYAQNHSINFEKKRSWNEAVKKATNEQKLIFVDCYAEWCGPCKALETNVFTNEKVADFFNRNFVSIQFDMEKDADGKAHAAQWGVSAYPTLIFIDPQTDSPIHKVVGSGDAEWLLSAARTALDPNQRLSTKMERYNNGERDPQFLMDFIISLNGSGMQKEAEQVARTYINSLSVDQMTEPANWLMIVQFENDPLSNALLAVRDNIDKFYAIPVPQQREIVDTKLASATVETAMQFAMNPNLAVYEKPRYEAFIEYLDEAEVPGKEMAAVWINTSMLARQNDWTRLVEVMRTVDAEKLLPPQAYARYFQYFITKLAESDDKQAIQNAVVWIDEIIASAAGEDAASYMTRGMMYGVKAAMLQAAGKYADAKKAQKEMAKYQKLLQEMGALPKP